MQCQNEQRGVQQNTREKQASAQRLIYLKVQKFENNRMLFIKNKKGILPQTEEL